MKIKYAGPRPQISYHGVTFKEGKEDKYVYLMIALQILKAIDINHDEHKKYSYDINTQRITDEDMFDIMISYEPKLEEITKQESIEYGLKLDHEIEELDKSHTLTDEEKQIWKNNLNIMKEYRIQRAINKIYYMHAIEFITEVIKREKIKEIDTPFFEKYWHVLQTIEGQFSNIKTPLTTDLKIVPNENGTLIAKMYVLGN